MSPSGFEGIDLPEVIAVVGPTASGKSAVADELAWRLDSAVVSADAMQVYRGMDIGTAKTPPGQRRVPLLCVDLVDPGEAYSVARFTQAAHVPSMANAPKTVYRSCAEVRGSMSGRR